MIDLRALTVLALLLPFAGASQEPRPRPFELSLARALRAHDDGLFDELARSVLGELPPEGSDALDYLLVRSKAPGGVGDDATLRRYASRLVAETDPRKLYLLAQHLRVQTTRRWGTLWTIDATPLCLLQGCLANDANELRRAFALIALSDVHRFDASPYLADESPLVRIAAATVLAAPEGASEERAHAVVTALAGLLTHERADVRATAARALGPWIFRESERDALVRVSDTDVDPKVRATALESLGSVPCLRSRARLREVLLQVDSSALEREAARRGLARSGILP